ncbi:MAG: hypothetical protein M1814_002652 [Vezdaea aestivalis]|nr:MAG: hypothetical protein M1814_002652 [Vezdaea aestivalis]
MATPTPSKTLAHELTPGTAAAHLAAFSPPNSHPRSVVQSPAHYKKSPSAFFQHGSSATSHPTGALSFDSPSAAALGLKLDMAPADPLMTSQYSIPDDDEIRRRMDFVLGRLRENPGRISLEGVAALAKRVGLDQFILDGVVTIAGTTLLIEISFEGDLVSNVDLSFPHSPDQVTSAVADAARILKADLTVPPDIIQYNSSLKAFEANLERLAKFDRLSIPNSVNCFEAVVGIYFSLRRLFDHEKAKALTAGKSVPPKQRHGFTEDEEAEREVLCRKSGRPLLHSGGSVGLRLDYWKNDQLCKEVLHNPKMHTSVQQKEKTDHSHQIWSLNIECEPCSSALYPSIRVSDKWLPSEEDGQIENDSDDVFAATGAAGAPPALNWQEPLSISIPPAGTDTSNEVDAMVNGAGPNVRFVAKLDPPLMLPLQVAYDIATFVGVVFPHEASPPIFDQLIIPKKEDEKDLVEGASRIVGFQRRTKIYGSEGKEEVREQTIEVYVHRQDYGKVITEIPFSHPQQLVGLLPILRQYARFSTLICNSIAPGPTRSESYSAANGTAKQCESKRQPSIEKLVQDDSEDLLVDFLSPEPPSFPVAASQTAIDLSFTMQPIPRISCTFNSPAKGKAPVAFHVEIDLNGEIKPVDPSAEDQSAEELFSPAKTARALAACEDAGLLIEFLKARLDAVS